MRMAECAALGDGAITENSGTDHAGRDALHVRWVDLRQPVDHAGGFATDPAEGGDRHCPLTAR